MSGHAGNREEILRSLFAEVLDLPGIGPHDNFFDVGGDSRLALRLVNAVRATFSVELPVRAFFRAPTVAALLEVLGEGGRVRPPVVRREHEGPVRPSSAQRRLWFVDRFGGPDGIYNVPVAMRMRGPVDHGALQGALKDLVLRHETLRTVFADEGGVPWQRVLGADEVEVPLVVEAVTAAELADRLAEAARTRFDLARDLMLHARYFELDAHDSVLALTFHHIAVDDGSMAPLFRDLSAAYAARLEGRAPQWAPLPVRYSDYAVWQHELLGAESDPDSLVSEQLRYWREQLSGLPDELALPYDRPRPATASLRGDRVPVTLDAELHRELATLAARTGTSLFMVLQAGFALLLTRLGAGSDIPIGVPTAGRTDAALEELVGFFVNLLVLRVDTSGEPGFEELLTRVRNRQLDALAHQDVPFDRLVEVLNPPRSRGRHPLVQVVLTLLEEDAGFLRLPGLECAEQHIDLSFSRYDLWLGLAESKTPDGSCRGMTGELRYSTELFDESTMRDLVRRLVELLREVVADPTRPTTPSSTRRVLTASRKKIATMEGTVSSR
ncbi:condensation domain-containing protein [Streptomyces sp. Li-HN-5-11]|uniref:condensation domain-containing protein n=1 Tax=Streptomyces sp. Li-HN-5-11 TaxID=3075432 RepID=UPI0028A87666|nr:condensation domain-containing protein [Streptomyces sp. Li-HN-5-11]WNM30390.1 condensation domain-containing protein [Streptomyces sp. Li-HN-5-11]